MPGRDLGACGQRFWRTAKDNLPSHGQDNGPVLLRDEEWKVLLQTHQENVRRLLLRHEVIFGNRVGQRGLGTKVRPWVSLPAEIYFFVPQPQSLPQLHSLPSFIGQFLPLFLQLCFSAAKPVVQIIAARIDIRILSDVFIAIILSFKLTNTSTNS